MTFFSSPITTGSTTQSHYLCATCDNAKLKKFGSQFEHNAQVASTGMNVKFCREVL